MKCSLDSLRNILNMSAEKIIELEDLAVEAMETEN
jgi:hypothetical protein